MATRFDILDRAGEIVGGHRVTEYGEPEDNFSVIARLWSAYLGTDISAQDVAMMMVLFKTGRIKSGTATEDSFIDIAGYAACGGEIASGEKADTRCDGAPEYEGQWGHSAYLYQRYVDIPLKDRETFDKVVSMMTSRTAEHGSVTAADVADAEGVFYRAYPGDERYGWTSADDVRLITMNGQYYLSLPAAKRLGESH